MNKQTDRQINNNTDIQLSGLINRIFLLTYQILKNKTKSRHIMPLLMCYKNFQIGIFSHNQVHVSMPHIY